MHVSSSIPFSFIVITLSKDSIVLLLSPLFGSFVTTSTFAELVPPLRLVLLPRLLLWVHSCRSVARTMSVSAPTIADHLLLPPPASRRCRRSYTPTRRFLFRRPRRHLLRLHLLDPCSLLPSYLLLALHPCCVHRSAALLALLYSLWWCLDFPMSLLPQILQQGMLPGCVCIFLGYADCDCVGGSQQSALLPLLLISASFWCDR